MFTSEAYTLQENTTIDGQIITAGELVVKSQYLCYMQEDTNCYWNQSPQQHVITVPTRTIIHPRLGVNAVTHFHAIPKIVCTRTQAKISISRQPICLTDYDHDCNLEEIGRRYRIEFKRDVELYCEDEEINMSISNECFMYLLYIHIFNVIRFSIYLFLQHQFDVFKYEYVCNII